MAWSTTTGFEIWQDFWGRSRSHVPNKRKVRRFLCEKESCKLMDRDGGERKGERERFGQAWQRRCWCEQQALLWLLLFVPIKNKQTRQSTVNVPKNWIMKLSPRPNRPWKPLLTDNRVSFDSLFRGEGNNIWAFICLASPVVIFCLYSSFFPGFPQASFVAQISGGIRSPLFAIFDVGVCSPFFASFFAFSAVYKILFIFIRLVRAHSTLWRNGWKPSNDFRGFRIFEGEKYKIMSPIWAGEVREAPCVVKRRGGASPSFLPPPEFCLCSRFERVVVLNWSFVKQGIPNRSEGEMESPMASTLCGGPINTLSGIRPSGIPHRRPAAESQARSNLLQSVSKWSHFFHLLPKEEQTEYQSLRKYCMKFLRWRKFSSNVLNLNREQCGAIETGILNIIQSNGLSAPWDTAVLHHIVHTIGGGSWRMLFRLKTWIYRDGGLK